MGYLTGLFWRLLGWITPQYNDGHSDAETVHLLDDLQADEATLPPDEDASDPARKGVVLPGPDDKSVC